MKLLILIIIVHNMYSKISVYNNFNIKLYIIIFIFVKMPNITQYNIVITVNNTTNIQVFDGTMNVNNQGIITALIDSTTHQNAITGLESSIQGVTVTNTFSYNANPQFGYFILQGDQYTSVIDSDDDSGLLAIRQSATPSESNVLTNLDNEFPLTSIVVTPLNTDINGEPLVIGGIKNLKKLKTQIGNYQYASASSIVAF